MFIDLNNALFKENEILFLNVLCQYTWNIHLNESDNLFLTNIFLSS